MINELISGIARAINSEFGDEYTIYAESVEQGLKEPCFFISCINPTIEAFPSKRYLRENLFVIQFLPADKKRKKEECNDAAERLFCCLELIEFEDGLVRGNNMRGEVSDGVLSFFVNYDLFVYKKDEFTAMEEMKRKVTSKK